MKSITYSGATYPTHTMPSVLGSAWQAPNGDVGYALTNISRAAVDFTLTVDAASTGLSADKSYTFHEVSEGVSRLLLPAAPLPQTLKLSIPALGVLLVPVTPH